MLTLCRGAVSVFYSHSWLGNYCSVNYNLWGTVNEDSSVLTWIILSEIWKKHAVLLGIHERSYNTNISLFLGINMWSMRRIWKRNNRICWRNQSHDWQRSQQIYQFHNQKHVNVWVSYGSTKSWRHTQFLKQYEKRPVLPCKKLKYPFQPIMRWSFSKYPFQTYYAWFFSDKKHIYQCVTTCG